VWPGFADGKMTKWVGENTNGEGSAEVARSWGEGIPKGIRRKRIRGKGKIIIIKMKGGKGE